MTSPRHPATAIRTAAQKIGADRFTVIRHAATAVVVIALGAMLSGCAATDPLLNESLWNPVGANEMNIAAQVANPRDLQQGRAPTGGADGQQAAVAIVRLRTNHVKALPDSATSDIHAAQAAPSAGGP